MNAKTTKFFAMLAVLAVAFAGCVILLGEQNDAADVTEVTKDTYPTNGTDAIASIELEDEADVKSVVLYDDSTVIEPTYAYFFADDADLFMSEDVLLSAPVMFFVLDEVELNIVAPTDKEFTDFGLIEFVFVKSYDDVNGIITLAEPKVFDAAGYAKVIGSIDVPNTYVSDANISYQKGDSFSIVADGEKAKKFVLGAIEALDLYGEGTEDEPAEFNLAGEIETVTIKTDMTAAVLTNFTGTVTDGTNTVELSGFTGKIVKNTNLILTGWVAGTLVSYTESETLVFDQIVFTEVGQYATFGKNVKIPVADNEDTAEVTFTRYVRDNYTLNVGGTLTAGSNGLTVAAGINGLEVSGSAVSKDAQLTFEGAAKVSGTFNADGGEIAIAGNDYQITLENLRVDNGDLTLGSEVVIQQQVTVNGNVDASANVIVAPESNFNVTQTFTGAQAGQATQSDDDTLLYVGKDATFRAQIVKFGETTYTLGTEGWVDVAFVDGTGAIYLNQNKVTNTSSAVIAYLFQIGAGTVSINSSACSTPSTYYIYNQVIPYLSLNPVDVVCTSTIAEKAEISLDGVSYTGGELPIGNQARYTIDYSTGVPMFYVEFIELYKTYVLAAYDADGKQKIVIYDEDGNMVDMVKGAAETTDNTTTGYTGIVKLAFNYDYTIQGINQYNKYTFTSKNLIEVSSGEDDPAEYETVIDFERLSNYASAFTMVRQELVTPADADIPEGYAAGDFGEIQYTEGLGMTLTVKITDNDDKLEVGDVLMYYTVVDEEGAEPQDDEAVAVYVTEDEDDNLVGIITNIYSTDTIFFKAADIEFYKLVVPSDSAVKNINMDTTEEILFSVKTWSEGYTFDSTKKTSTFPVSCEKNLTTVVFEFAATTPANQEIVIDFSNFCGDTSLHAKTIKLKETSEEEDMTIQMCVGEVYTMTLKYIKTYIEDVLYPNPDYDATADPQTQPECLAYNGEAVTVKATEEPFTYTIVYEKVKELEVVNKYSKGITMIVGDYSVDIAAGATGKLIVNQGYAGKTRLTGEPMELSMIGYDVKKWYYTTYTGGTADTDNMPVLVDNSVTPESVETILTDKDMKIDINDVRADRIVYLVKVDPIYQKVITYYDQSGYYETPMVAYVQPEFGEKTFGVEYVYIVDGVEVAGQAVQSFTAEGQEYWAYNMPAYDVELRPIIAKPTYQVSFVDSATGEAVGEAIDVVPFSTDPIEIPAKFGYVATAATTDAEIEGDFVFDAETQTVTFEMPTSEVVITVTYDAGGPFSEEMELFVSKTTDGVKITIIANDDLPIQSGYITIDYWYVYEEDGIYGMEQVVLDPVEFATSGAGVIESITISLAEEEFFGAIYYVSATFEPIDGDAMKSDYIAYQMA